FCCAAFFVGIVSCVCSYRLSTTEAVLEITSTPEGTQQCLPSFHESLLFLLILAASMTAYFIELVRASNMSFFSAKSILILIAETMRYTPTYIPLAILGLALQLIYVRWKQRGQRIPWKLQGLSAERFSWNFIALAALFAVAIPTLTIYCFTFWLGP